jgi:hypothetical protein
LDEGHLSLRGVADEGMQPPNISEMRIGRLPSRQTARDTNGGNSRGRNELVL